MLEKIVAFYSKNNRNLQFYEYITIIIIVIQIVIISNLAAIIDNHPVSIFDIALHSTLFAFAVLPVVAARELWEINKAARFFLPAELGRASKRTRMGRIESMLLRELEGFQSVPSFKDVIFNLNRIIDINIKKYTGLSFICMIPFFVSAMASSFIVLYYHNFIFDLIPAEAVGQWERRTKLLEIHSSKTNLMTNLLWATVALQIASGLAIKAAYSDLHSAVEGWLASESIEGEAQAISPLASP